VPTAWNSERASVAQLGRVDFHARSPRIPGAPSLETSTLVNGQPVEYVGSAEESAKMEAM